MTTCKECGAAISDKAASCPSCGAPPKKPTSRLSIALAGLVLIFVLQAIFRSNNAPSPPPKTAAELAADRELQEAVMILRAVKASMKNPASFDLVNAIRLEGGILCIEYRATNSFNAITTSMMVVRDGKADASGELWNRHCANKTGRDISHARAVL